MTAISAIKAFCKACSTCKLKNVFANAKPQKAIISKIPLSACDTVEIDHGKVLRSKLLSLRDEYLKTHPDAFLTLDHIKSNYDNTRIMRSIKGQTRALDAVSTEDFSNLSEIMKGIRTPEEMTVYRAMEGGDFNIGRITPEKFIIRMVKLLLCQSICQPV